MGERIHAYVWLSPFVVHLKLSQHCLQATLQYKIKSIFLEKSQSSGHNSVMNLQYGTSMHHFFSKHRQIVKLKRESRKKQSKICNLCRSNKARGGDESPAELFQVKNDAVKVLHSICQQIWKTQQWTHRTRKGQFSFQSQRKAMPKNVLTTTQLHSSHMLAK